MSNKLNKNMKKKQNKCKKNTNNLQSLKNS